MGGEAQVGIGAGKHFNKKKWHLKWKGIQDLYLPSFWDQQQLGIFLEDRDLINLIKEIVSVARDSAKHKLLLDISAQQVFSEVLGSEEMKLFSPPSKWSCKLKVLLQRLSLEPVYTILQCCRHSRCFGTHWKSFLEPVILVSDTSILSRNLAVLG